MSQALILDRSEEQAHPRVSSHDSTAVDWPRILLIAIALTYALLAGLRTVADFDTGWQLATGRYVVQHHAIFSTDVFSYTAHGKPWLYPPLSSLFLYVLFLVGGYSALSWLSALASAATVGLVAWGGDWITAALALVAVPAIVFRTVPRADMFTTVIFAAFAAILWRYREGKNARLWALPVLMLAWANLHVGFLAGFALIGAYALVELGELPFRMRRDAALSRLRHAGPWLGLACLAPFANRWGWRIYEAVARQNAGSEILNGYIGEWSRIHLSSAVWAQALSWRDPGSADWWLLTIAGVAASVSIWRKEPSPTLILGAGAYASLEHNRFQAIFAILVCIVGGSVLSRAFKSSPANAAGPAPEIGLAHSRSRGWRGSIPEWVVVILLLAMAGLRTFDLVTDRFYLWSAQTTLFGTGLSWWFPERAVNFLREQHLPGNLFNDFNTGGYLTWSAPEYPDYIDGRILPFGSEFFAHHDKLMALPLDSAEWQKEADARNIQTVILSVARYGGLGNFPLQADCQSQNWATVYVDDVSIIFVRKLPENGDLIRRLGIQCDTAPISGPPIAWSDTSRRASAERFQYLMNAASIQYVLSRDAEVSRNLDQAEKLFSDDPNLYLLRAQLAQAHGQYDQAERQYKIALQIRPADASWYALGVLYASEHRYSEALHCVLESAAMSTEDYDRYRALGKLYLAMNRPRDALLAFEAARRKSPFQAGTAQLGVEFNARVAEGEAAAYSQLGDHGRALMAQAEAVRLTPENAARWQTLAEMYQADGRPEDANKARQRAASLQAPSSPQP